MLMEGMLQLSKRTVQDGDMWSAYCDELEIGSCGSSEPEAIANLDNAIRALWHAREKHT
ncbi:hypothetical protein LCGC14_2679710 [marine sediment metagenome]|uniref:HicB-like antitoxin of toxin-antitoxin system domain-containing protein n=1 Tax=marine sediment metagenome TaxID=412755 RepID=A0A0F9A9B4_9ZZZZ